MTDAQFIDALESCTLPPKDFGHAGHVRAGYAYLKMGGFAAALERMRRAIRGYSEFLGKPERYHETMTVAYLALIARYLEERGDGEGGFSAFAQRSPEMFAPDLLLRFYPRFVLESDLARRQYVLPSGVTARPPTGAERPQWLAQI